jgi:hypothetical protein
VRRFDSIASIRFKLACDHQPVIDAINRRSVGVLQLPLAEQSESHSRPQALVIGDHRRGVMRGVIRAVILSSVIWLTAGCLTFVLR